MNYLPELASNCDPPDLSLPSSKDYRSESLVPGWKDIFNDKSCSDIMLSLGGTAQKS
jgi:hypothetical protein